MFIKTFLLIYCAPIITGITGFNLNQQKVPVTSCSQSPTDIQFLVDDSASLKDSNFKRELLFVNQIISFFDLSPSLYQVGVTTFSTNVQTHLKLGSTNDKSKIYSIVANISPSKGMTFLGKALKFIIQNGFTTSGGSRKGAKKVLIIVTDGDTLDLEDTLRAKAILVEFQVEIFIIGIGHRLNQENLQRIVTQKDNLFQTEDFNQLPKIADSLKQVVCKKDKMPVTSCSQSPTDIQFLVDDSASLKDSNFKRELLFVNQIISFFDLSPSLYQVGVTTFSTNVQTHLKLGSTNDKSKIYSIVANISPSKGMTFLGKALKFIIQNGFTTSGGSRKGAKKVLIIVTDGDTLDLEDTLRAKAILVEFQVEIFIIGIGHRLNQENLQRIVTQKDNLFQTEDFNQLPKIADSLKQVVCKKDKTPVCLECSLPATDLLFLVDDSSSLKGTDFSEELIFVQQLINFFHLSPLHYQVGIATFSNDLHSHLELGSTTSKTQIKTILNGIRPTLGMTFLGKSLLRVVGKAFGTNTKSRTNARKVLVVITDGDTIDADLTIKMAEKLKNSKMEIFAVGIGKHFNPNLLEKIVSIPENLFKVEDFKKLKIIANFVKKSICGKTTKDCSLFK